MAPLSNEHARSLLHSFLLLALSVACSGMQTSQHGCCRDVKIRIGMPGSSSEPYFNYSSGVWTGFIVDFVDDIANDMGFSYEFVSASDPIGQYLSACDNPFINNGTLPCYYDATLVGITSDAYVGLFFADISMTAPILIDSFAALVKLEDSPPFLFAFLSPFEASLWEVVLATLGALAVLLVTIDAITKEATVRGFIRRLVSPRSFIAAVYHGAAMLVGGEDYEWFGWPMRVLRLGALFFTFIVGATYTANLASFFTLSGKTIGGPATMADLNNSKVCTTALGDQLKYISLTETAVVPSPLTPFVSEYNSPTEGDLDQRLSSCDQKLTEGEVDAWIDPTMLMDKYQLSACDHLAKAAAISFGSASFGFMFKGYREFAALWSMTVIELQGQPRFQDLLRRYFGIGQSCEVPDGDTQSVSLESMLGLIMVTYSIFGLALISAIARRYVHLLKGVDPGGDDLSHDTTEGEMLKHVLEQVREIKLAQEITREQERKECA